jgi:hypothetical protein
VIGELCFGLTCVTIRLAGDREEATISVPVRVASLVVGAAGLVLGCPLASSAPSRTAADFRELPTLSGRGDRVVSVSLPRGPILFVLTNGGSSNFIVQLVGPEGRDYLTNEIGPWTGGTLAPDVRAGRHRLAVQAEGAWRIFPYVPQPSNFSRPLLGKIAFTTSMVYALRSSRAGDVVVTASNSGHGNFIVKLVGVGSLSGTELLFNEIGPYHGQTLVTVPKGPLLLWVQAKGRWSVRLSR